MKILSAFLTLALVTYVLAGLIPSQASAASITIQTIKDNSVYSGSPTTNAGAATTLDATTSDMSYILFDLNAIAVAENVPANQIQLTGALFKAIDWRTTNNGVNILYLADVSGGWNEGTFNWNDAAASYGAVGGVGTASLDSSKTLWEGRLDFSAATVVDVAATSQAPFTDVGLLASLQSDLSTGDGQVVFVMRGQSGSNRYSASKENTATLPPRLILEYSVTPEPSTTLLALIGLSWAVGCYRHKSRCKWLSIMS